MLNRERQLSVLAAAQAKHEWMKIGYGYRLLSTLKIGILGASGEIGRALTKLAKAFGMTVYGARRKHSASTPTAASGTTATTESLTGSPVSSPTSATAASGSDGVDRWFELPAPAGDGKETADSKSSHSNSDDSGFADMLSQIDYLVSILPSTPETTDLLSGDVLKACATSAERPVVFINVGRGNVINDESLLNALNRKWLTAAVLDGKIQQLTAHIVYVIFGMLFVVFNTEPLPPTHALWSHPDVTITPHVAALSSVVAKDIVLFFEQNVQRRRSGQLPLNLIDFEKGY
jgi:phosphoglycerate dehydrogenase-like enzyme